MAAAKAVIAAKAISNRNATPKRNLWPVLARSGRWSFRPGEDSSVGDADTSIFGAAGADSAHIVKYSGVDAGVRHGRHRLAACIKPLRPVARPAIEVPVKSVDEGHTLGDIEPEAVDIRDEHQERHQRLRTRR